MKNELIKDFLKQNGMSQKHFAKKLGVTNITVNNWVSGRSKPTSNMKVRIIKFISKLSERVED